MGMEGIELKDKWGRTIAVAQTDAQIIATGVTAGIMAGAVLVNRKKQYTGYVPKAVLDELNVSTVQIPANFAGLEAIDVPTRLEDQLFEIYDVDEQDEYVEISARHIFYQNLKNYTLWKPTEETQYTAAAVCRNVISNAMFDAKWDVASDCTDTLPGKDFDYDRKNLVECFLDPENGICAKFGLSLLRDNTVFYCLKNVGYDRGYLIESGKNLLGVDRHENLDPVYTRIAPYGKDAKGNIVWMNHNGLKYIDSQYIDTYAEPKLYLYETDLQIGKDGVTADNIQEKLLAAAEKCFDEDEIDKPEVTMTIEFISLGDTEEYAQYRGLDKVYLYDVLTIRDAKRGYNYSAQVIGVEHDVINGRLNSVTIGSLKQAAAARKIATWQVPEVSGTNIRLLSLQAGVFSPGAINTEDIAPNTITADLIKAGAVVTEKLAANAITTDKLAANAITAGNIAAGAVTAAAIASGAITTDKLDAGAVTAAKIAAGTITADRLDSTTVNAAIATIANAEIGSADIGFAQIKALTTESLIARDAVTDRYFIAKLAVENAQMIHATVGDLVIKAADNNYYRLNIDAEGQLAPVQVTLTQGEITAGVTSDGRGAIIETDLTVSELSASNMKGINALIDKITAQRIDVQELFARSAFIGALNTADISNNQSILLHINKKSANYIQWEDPNNGTNTINKGDIWEQRPDEGQTITDLYGYTIAEMAEYPIWAFMYGRQYMWNGTAWEIVQDNAKTTDVLTELKIADGEIRSSIISLGARMTSVETIISEDGIRDLIVEEMTEEVRQDIIDGAAGAAIDEILASKAAFVQWDTPQESSGTTIRFGTLWLKDHGYRTIASCSSVTISTASNWTIESFEGGRLYMYAGVTGTYDPAYWRLVDDYGKTVTKTTELNRTTDGILARVSTVETSFLGVEQRVSSLEITDAQIELLVAAAQATADNAYVRRAGILIDPDGVRIKATASDGGASLLDILRTGIKVYSGGNIEIKSGASFTVASGNFSIDASGNVTVKGKIEAGANSVIGGWTLGADNLHAGSGSNYVAISSAANGTYAIWAGAESAASAPFRVTKTGGLEATKVSTISESGTVTEINLSTAGLWKLNYHVIKTIATSGGYASSMTLSNGTTVNFKQATAGWSEAVAMVGNFDLDEGGAWIEIDVPSAQYGQQTSKGYDLTTAFENQYNAGSPKGVAIGTRVSGAMYQATVTRNDDTTVLLSAVNCATPYNDGQSAGQRTGWSSAASMVGTMSEEDDLVTIQVPSVNYNQPRTASLDVTYIRTAGSKQGYNSALSDSGIPNGGTVYSGGSYYSRLYTVGTHGEAIYQGPGVVNPTSHQLTPK